MIKEFKEFALKGNMVDLAIGIIIGGAFGKIVTSLVNDMIMPLIGVLLGDTDFTNLFVVLGEGQYLTLEEAQTAGALTLNYGLFLNNIVDFLIIAFAIFMVIKQLNKMKRKEEMAPAPETTKKCSFCFEEVHIDATRCPHCTSVIE
ncbi:large conductance mechanosensitive channel protein MscL [Alkalibacter saccharofermentans]|uniref:Large-conductance mechanosensitive channel n=1 Tax=Alkalibacter saccharofermentans DSM 14828 TaxID=1120975 RepID=A0A1M4SMP7_9FIRM|nr:large conductance mechanosensitive channel protein MscL [Alkalibacter saccharofermentans]SHE33466.1 large conductance mechanosensitive channel [Alkalibacter saccharofermentans DSM 14828]